MTPLSSIPSRQCDYTHYNKEPQNHFSLVDMYRRLMPLRYYERGFRDHWKQKYLHLAIKKYFMHVS